MSEWIEAFGDLRDYTSGCMICHGEEFLSVPVEEQFSMFRSEGTRCPCWTLYMAAQRLWERGFPRGYVGWNWDSLWPVDPATVDVQQWEKKHPVSYNWTFSDADDAALHYWVNNNADAFKRGLSLVLWGDKGVGKTALACVLAKEAVKRRGIDAAGWLSSFVPRFLVADQLYAALSGARTREAGAMVQEAFDASLLVLDDLRMVYTGFVQVEYIERLHTILQHRASCNRPTIITMNKLGTSADFASNSITEFMGLLPNEEPPQKHGKNRFIHLTNPALRPEPEWDV